MGCYAAAKLLRIKQVVFDYRDEWEDAIISSVSSQIYKRSYRFLKLLFTKFYAHSSTVIAVTEAMSQSLSLRGVKNVKVVTNGADTGVFKPYPKNLCRKKLGLKETDFVLVYNGGLHTYYRLDIVLKALKKVIDKADNLKLIMVGYGSNIKFILNLSKELGLEERVFYLGSKQDKSELAEIISACDVGLVPYDSNPLWKTTIPAKALEYFACGLPILVTYYKDSLIADFISVDQVGLRSDPNNIDQLARNIEKIYNEPSFVAEAAKRAISLVERCFDRNKKAELLLDYLLSGS